DLHARGLHIADLRGFLRALEEIDKHGTARVGSGLQLPQLDLGDVGGVAALAQRLDVVLQTTYLALNRVFVGSKLPGEALGFRSQEARDDVELRLRLYHVGVAGAQGGTGTGKRCGA